MACCKGDEYWNACNGEEIVWIDPQTHEEYCWLHAPLKHSGLTKEDFKERFLKFISLQHTSAVKLTDVDFFCDIELDKKKLPLLAFKDCVFHQDFKIASAIIPAISLSSVVFHGSFELLDLTIDGLISAHDVYFDEELSIKFCRIKENFDCELSQPPKIMNLYFEECRQFSLLSESNDGIHNFVLEIAKQPADQQIIINGLTLHNFFLHTILAPVLILNCTFKEFSTLLCSTSPKITFETCIFERLSIETHKVHTLKFFGCQFPKTDNHRNHIENALFNDNNCTKEEFFRTLKKQAQDSESRMLASDWHYWEKYYCEQRLFTGGAATEWLMLWLYRLLSDYAESVGKTAGWLLIFILTPLLIAYLSQLPLPDSGIDLTNIAKQGLNYIPLATRTPPSDDVSLWRLLELFWQILITFQATLLGFALRNRYRR